MTPLRMFCELGPWPLGWTGWNLWTRPSNPTSVPD